MRIVSVNIFFRGFALLLFFWFSSSDQLVAQLAWPDVGQQQKPWTRWWWMGSAVNKNDITALLEKYQQAGLGGVEITPIYGVTGYEDQFIEYLSDEWMEMLIHTLTEATRLDIGVDMATGTGWPFGGPWVGAGDASRYVTYQTYSLEEGETLPDKVTYQQQPLVRAVGYNVYQTYGIDQAEASQSTEEKPLIAAGHKPIEITEIKEPIAANEHLQAMALDQVRFDKPLPLQVLMAYSDQGESLDITEKVDQDGTLDWTAPAGQWTLYAVFSGWHGKMVERAAPGGEGNVINHFSETALNHYLQRFDEALAGQDISTLRAFFNDSYEVDDARGQANWTPDLLAEFEQRRGYDLREYLPALFGHDTEETSHRVLTDYRETVSELLLEKFTEPWGAWAKEKGAIIRNQSHGSPANILDLYAASDIPETEGNDLLRFKFATSAAHVTGKKLASAEAATWLNEHFTSSLADVKQAINRFFLGGVNHIFYHGTNYSPSTEAWPGWLFYAAVHFTPTNSFWRDLDALNRYVARCQSFLQAGTPDQDVLLYYPVHNYYGERGEELLAHFDGFEEEDQSSFRNNTGLLQEQGYTYDFISDRQLQNINLENQQLLSGESTYQVLVLSEAQWIPLETLQKMIVLAKGGATVIVHRRLPASTPGMMGLKAEENQEFKQLLEQLDFDNNLQTSIQEARIGQGRVLLGENMEALLDYAAVRRESMVDQGLQFVRRKYDDGYYYFIANEGEEALDEWIPLAVAAQSVGVFDPMLQKRGLAEIQKISQDSLEVYLQLSPGETCLLQTFESPMTGTPYAYYQDAGSPLELEGSWNVSFIDGGPELPLAVETERLGSWTDFPGEAVKNFSGTARYTTSFARPTGDTDAWRLDLGKVGHSASIRLNGEEIGSLLGPNFSIVLDKSRVKEINTLEVAVTNLMGNRIAELDRSNVGWKKFYNINFPARLQENSNENGLFSAADWKPQESGLLGPVTITPVSIKEF